MFNLLPEILQQEVKIEYKKRLLVTALIFVLFVQISFLVFLFPTWIISVYQEKEAVELVDANNKVTSSKDSTSIASVIGGTNTKLNIISSSMDYPEVLPLVDIIISNKISSIHINQIIYTSTKGSGATISLGGVADTRDSLVLFSKNLENSKKFNEVNLPVSNFAKDKNINFSISMVISG